MSVSTTAVILGIGALSADTKSGTLNQNPKVKQIRAKMIRRVWEVPRTR